MEWLLLALYGLTGTALIALVLLQHGKGSDIGAAFGSGASNAIFGPVGPGGLLSRATTILAAIFFVLSLVLAWQAKQQLAPPVEQEPAAEAIQILEQTVPSEPPPASGGGGDLPSGLLPEPDPRP